MKGTKYIAFIFGTLFVGLNGCIEPFEAETQSFEDALVIDALLTNEEKQHRVILARTYRFEDEGPAAERNANVVVKDDMGNTHEFQETEPGQYSATVAFGAIPGVSYELMIKTSDGKSYRSNTVVAPDNVPIDKLYAEREIDDLGEEGVSILLDNSSTSVEPTYFRYEYEETYKIIAPNYYPFEFEIIHYIACDTLPYQVDIKPRIEQKRVCFGSRKSIGPIRASTTSLTDNNLSRFRVRFVGREDYIMSHRYTLKVNQFSQTQEAHSYYERLGDFSSSDNVFSQIQPGFLEGNIRAEEDEEQKVLGYFEVASVSSERVYFNYADLFPDELLPPYAINCNSVGNPPLYGPGYHCHSFRECDGDCTSPLIEAILADIVVFQSENEMPTADFPGPYFTLPSPCGDCTKLGSTIVPDFWEE